MADMYILTTRTRCAPVNIWQTINYIRSRRGGNTHVQVFCESPHKKRGTKMESLIELKNKKNRLEFVGEKTVIYVRLRVLFLGVAVRNGYKPYQPGVEEGAIGQHTRHAFIHRLPLQVAAGERERLCWPPFFLDLDSLLLLVVYYSIPLAHHRVFYMRTMVVMCCCCCCCVLSWPLFIS